MIASGLGTDTLSGIEPVAGSAHDDNLTGRSARGDWISASTGNDTVSGLAGDDLLDGGPGNDTVNGGPGSDVCVNAEVAVGC